MAGPAAMRWALILGWVLMAANAACAASNPNETPIEVAGPSGLLRGTMLAPPSGPKAPVVLILYGVGWWVGGAISGKTWVKWVAFGSFVGAPLITLMAGRPEQLLAYAVCLVAFTTVPGVIVMRGNKA